MLAAATTAVAVKNICADNPPKLKSLSCFGNTTALHKQTAVKSDTLTAKSGHAKAGSTDKALKKQYYHHREAVAVAQTVIIIIISSQPVKEQKEEEAAGIGE